MVIHVSLVCRVKKGRAYLAHSSSRLVGQEIGDERIGKGRIRNMGIWIRSRQNC